MPRRLAHEIIGLPWRKFAGEVWRPTCIFLKFVCFMDVLSNYVGGLTLPMGPSMLPTFNISGDVVLTEKISHRFGKIKHGDIILLRSPENPRKVVAKRITGMEGDCVDSNKTEHGKQNQQIVVPKGHVWVEGDNPSVSKDSRNYGAAPCALIEGKLFFRIWPIEGFGHLK
ncbi:mitochondrial ATP-independent inner membrane protease subunit 1a [Cryptomeria japonica]|uniref:mitochondrial ATP-independent inner membrane protease subunit 1a n=1 Tax=Cryptomeria japonica TaxID=3369 RepID=UPI0027DA3D58|nr:mitochondrial ATP-independent inner membrane protease subunit 1a [Cryptomeria japonica]